MMFGLFNGDPEKKLCKQYNAKLEAPMQAQCNPPHSQCHIAWPGCGSGKYSRELQPYLQIAPCQSQFIQTPTRTPSEL